jgi:hypothetical protein
MFWMAVKHCTSVSSALLLYRERGEEPDLTAVSVILNTKVDPFVKTKFGPQQANLGRVGICVFRGGLGIEAARGHSGARSGARVASLRSPVFRSSASSIGPAILAGKR